MGKLMRALVEKLDHQIPPLVEAPPVAVVVEPRTSSHSTQRSIETLVVVLAVIIIVALIAGIIARLCGGRHFGSSGDHDTEGWVERKCRNCIDSGVPAAPLPPRPETPKPAATEEAKK